MCNCNNCEIKAEPPFLTEEEIRAIVREELERQKVVRYEDFDTTKKYDPNEPLQPITKVLSPEERFEGGMYITINEPKITWDGLTYVESIEKQLKDNM